MNTYAIGYKKNKNIEEIDVIFIGEDTAFYNVIGDMYNLYDFIIDTNFNNDNIIFCNFTGNQLEKLFNHITKYKNIDNIINYKSIVISNKKKIRGLNYAKMD